MPKKTFGEDLYAKGENTNGQVSQTADGTIYAGRAYNPQQYNGNLQADSARWNKKPEVGKEIMPKTYPKHDK